MGITMAQGDAMVKALQGRGEAAEPAFAIGIEPMRLVDGPMNEDGSPGEKVPTTGTIVREANPKRNGLLIVNNSDTQIWIALGPEAAVGKGIPLAPHIPGAPGGQVLIGNGGLNYNGPVSAIHVGKGGKVVVGAEV